MIQWLHIPKIGSGDGLLFYHAGLSGYNNKMTWGCKYEPIYSILCWTKQELPNPQSLILSSPSQTFQRIQLLMG